MNFRQRVPAQVIFKPVHDLKLYLDREKTKELPRGRALLEEFIHFDTRTKLYGFSSHVDRLLEQYCEVPYSDDKRLHDVIGTVPAIPRPPTANRIGGPLTLKDGKVDKEVVGTGLSQATNKPEIPSRHHTKHSKDTHKKSQNKQTIFDDHHPLLDQILGAKVHTVKVPDSTPFMHPHNTAHKWGIPVVLKYLCEVIELPQYDGAEPINLTNK